METKQRRKHLHASVGAATLYGMAIGLWLGKRAGEAGFIEMAAFVAVLMFAPAIIMSRLDARYRYTD